jgi:hypothetical protein
MILVAVFWHPIVLQRPEIALNHRVIPAVASTTHALNDPVFCQTCNKSISGVLGEFNRSSQHPEIGGCDDGLQTRLGSMHKKEVACARAPACLAA